MQSKILNIFSKNLIIFRCVSKWNNNVILTLTGPIFVIPESSEEETRLRGRVKSYIVINFLKEFLKFL